MSTHSFLLIMISASALVTGCSKPKIDVVKYTETRIQEMMKSEKLAQVDAIEFLEEGGFYVETRGFDDPPFDKPHVIPLLKTLSEEFEFQWVALTGKGDKSYKAYDIVTEIPIGTSKKKVQHRLEELQKEFPGDILQSWGENWFSLSFNDVETSKLLAEED